LALLGIFVSSSPPAATPSPRPVTVVQEGPASNPKSIEGPSPLKAKEPVSPPRPAGDLREQEAARRVEEIRALEKRLTADETRRLYAEFVKDFGDTAQGKTVASWLKSLESKPPDPLVVEAKPESPKGPVAPKAPEPPAPASPRKKPPAPAPAGPAAKRSAVPDAAKLRETEAAVRKTFNIDQAKTAKDKAALARTLLQAATSSGAKDAELYVLLRTAKDLAAQGLDVKTALEAIDARADAFDADAKSEKVDLFVKTTAKGTEASVWGGAALELAKEMSDADDYDSAIKLATRAETLSRTTTDKWLHDLAKEREKELTDWKRLADGLKPHYKTLETKPDDATASSAVGKFVCLAKGEWTRGLPMLAKGSDAALKGLAEQELGNPKESASQAALAEAWVSWSDKESSTYKAAGRARAAEWLRRALPGLTGMSKISAEKKLASFGPDAGPKNRLWLDLGEGVRIEFVAIQPGTFTMGSPQTPPGSGPGNRVGDERPEHKVTISKGFWLGKYEITRGQFAAFVRATGYRTDAEKAGRSNGRRKDGTWENIPGSSWKDPLVFKQTDEHPVMNVGLNDARAFCEWATKKTGRNVRLPTEAEWEYACRAGTRSRFTFGDSEANVGDYAWTAANSGFQTQPVGQKRPNFWGLYDMYGNVSEWCSDPMAPYPSADVVDPVGRSGNWPYCLRGGNWGSEENDCRSGSRFSRWPDEYGSQTGFRVEASLP
jgi:formylglycine-generating enzyme required for sulfatase activity